ncbi:hypothetical protein FOC1_g10008128 [Fusarium oxysporum f. sp. cubense race 1]|jgi:hypothetical protein|uniref:Uncharacterized protein n=1 Tax=Fusarium oxysporum f. sp. cubense (strain race 1) TaxID=1229664 RepID=N4UBE2_FUSC1|nr:hypothetical protein FOC1_g10008128 [Fusarium oxysporum f. sp. cubense race 1]
MATTAMIQPNPPKRSDSDVSPRTVNPPRNSASEDAKVDYFPDSNTVDGSNTSVRASDGDDSSARKSSISFAPDPRRSSSCESNQNSAPGQDSTIQRKSSTGSVSFRRMTNPQLPQGNPQQMNNSRIRASSPNHSRYVATFFIFSPSRCTNFCCDRIPISSTRYWIALATLHRPDQT